MTNQYFTKEGLEKLKGELEQREKVLRGEIADRLKEAKEQGDLAENAAFDAAKSAQAANEGRIEEIKAILENAVIFEEGKSNGIVALGSSVTAEAKGDKKQYVIVGAAESDPIKGFISNDSPIGQAFMGRQKGDKVTVHTPKGEVEYKILEIK